MVPTTPVAMGLAWKSEGPGDEPASAEPDGATELPGAGVSCGRSHEGSPLSVNTQFTRSRASTL